jgi:hypothetical protein
MVNAKCQMRPTNSMQAAISVLFSCKNTKCYTGYVLVTQTHLTQTQTQTNINFVFRQLMCSGNTKFYRHKLYFNVCNVSLNKMWRLVHSVHSCPPIAEDLLGRKFCTSSSAVVLRCWSCAPNKTLREVRSVLFSTPHPGQLHQDSRSTRWSFS